MPLSPASSPAQVPSASAASGVVAATAVTTTLRKPSPVRIDTIRAPHPPDLFALNTPPGPECPQAGFPLRRGSPEPSPPEFYEPVTLPERVRRPHAAQRKPMWVAALSWDCGERADAR
ncbi:saccharopine dehydrogenase [Mycolicibacterium thermoresistibile]|uniref:Saccharopine dehydrogenase n=1 Tax=Mycolicibacterium thermoresistibile TaxID=1797 RepID=A0A100XBG6_MYCTH|nr:saccharopine dehydrogenase [Mycolicibacterium thermoresistibile]